MTAPTIEALRPGTFRDMRGKDWTLTKANLVELASSYDRTAAPSPVVIGHPKTDDPAYGWIDYATLGEDDKLRLTLRDLDPNFSAAVEAKRYQKVSVALFTPESPHNPKPGKWYLRHLGFLGAVPPAVTGLHPVQFAGGDDGVIEFAAAVEDGTGDDSELSRLKAENARLCADVAQLKQQSMDRERASRHAENVEFAAGLVGSGRLVPAQRDNLVVLLDALVAVDEPVAFASGDDAESVAPLDALRKILAIQPPHVPLGEAAPADPEFAAEEQSPYTIAEKAMQIQAEAASRGESINIAQAVHMAQAGRN